jgi:hypothetical protein
MAPEPCIRRLRVAMIVAALAALAAAPPAHALRLVNWNLLNYPGSTGAIRDPYYRVVLTPLAPDFMVADEVTSQAAVNEFLSSVLNTMEPGQWAAAPFVDGNDTDCGFFYKPSKVQYLGQWSFYPNPANLLRLIHVYRIKPIGYSATASEIRVYGLHLKASTGSANVAQRAAEAKGLRDTLDALPAGVNALASGDYNFYTGAEPAMDTLLAIRVNNRGRLYDPLGLQGISWQDNASMAGKHTQCPSTTAYRPNGGYSGGGLDDRFDLLLPTYDLADGQAIELLPSSYVSVGNDGLHMNKSVTDAPIAPADTAYARALWWCSDHLPVRVDLRLPAQIGATTPLAFGTVIVGAGATQLEAVADTAHTPADSLRYTLAADPGFTAPAGNFAIAPGDPAALHSVGMITASAGNMAGNLTIASNDVDVPTRLVALAGTVLDHASASLDSTIALLADTLDFGSHESGQFSTMLARVHNRGYDALQAPLAVSGGAITGGAGRFSIVGGFAPALVAGTAASYTIAFDDNGASADSTYQATLDFSSADEALPGAAAQPGLGVTLLARRAGGTVAVDDARRAPGTTRLYAPAPNPMPGHGTLRFDLARATDAKLEIFDLAGRRVSTVASGSFEPGRYAYPWNGRRSDGAALGAGLYFVRLTGRGIETQTARLAMVH